ncbi:MAG: potassium-transporting ATPase subunit KdpC [Bryobacterales bacterium]|nr:potassium-transporting ATPase subunit KdpC [Bryobacterales bacterium]
MGTQIRTSILMLLVLTVLTGVVYPIAVTGIAQLTMPDQANGSLIRDGDRITGSRLIGRQFDDPRYFWSRLSATSPTPYNAASSSGSNYGPLSPDLKRAVDSRVQALRAVDPLNTALIPVDLVTASGSGLDPEISPEAALYQSGRVARVRGIDEGVVRRLVESMTQHRQLGFLGEPRVNVVLLNQALDNLRR